MKTFKETKEILKKTLAIIIEALAMMLSAFVIMLFSLMCVFPYILLFLILSPIAICKHCLATLKRIEK